MKLWPLLIGIIVILALLCSPALAIISKSDLISYYNQTNPIRIPTPTPTQTPLIPSVWVTPTPVPTYDISVIEPLHGVGSISVISEPPGANVYIDGTLKGTTPLTVNGLPIISHRHPGCTIFFIIVSKPGYQENNTFVYLFIGEHRTISITLIPTTPTPAWYMGQGIPVPKPTLTPPMSRRSPKSPIIWPEVL